MTRDEVYHELTLVFRKVFANDRITLNDAMTAKDIAQWDSMNHINLIVGAEQKFKIKFQTAEIVRFANVGDFVNTILKKLPG